MRTNILRRDKRNMPNPMMINGIPVHTCSWLTKEKQVPKKKCRFKFIQKILNKIYGFETVQEPSNECLLFTNPVTGQKSFIMHPETWGKMQEVIKKDAAV
jgi:hypothetical protein